MKHNTKKLAQAALLLAICLIAQYFKNISVYITGPIINACLIIAALAIGPVYALILSVITPVTAFFFTGSPIMAAIPLMFPVIMAGNAILALGSWYFYKKLTFRYRLVFGMIAGSIVKAAFMGLVIVGVLLPSFGSNIASHLPKPEALPGVLAAARVTFSWTQLFAGLIGSALAWMIWIPLKKSLNQFD